MGVPAKILYTNSSQYIELAGLKDQSTNPATYMNSATVLGTLKDPKGVPVTGLTAITGVYQSASNGTYRLPVNAATFNPPIGGGYVLVITATQNGNTLYVEYPIKIQVRQTGLEA